jgi:hypothetical protein
MPLTRNIFISYAHKDKTLFEEVRKHLDCLEYMSGKFWTDQEILGGQEWNKEIEAAIDDAHLAILLLSPEFIVSDYIRTREMSMFMDRARAGKLIVYPVLLETCAWNVIPVIEERQVRPRGDTEPVPLATLHEEDKKKTLIKLAEEISRLLKMRCPPDSERSIQLLKNTLLADLEQGNQTPQLIVAQVADQTGTKGDALFDVIRFMVEYQLLCSERPTSLMDMWGDRTEVRKQLPKGSPREQSIQADPRFFFLTLDREPLWKAYFKSLADPNVGGLSAENSASQSSILIRNGFLAPQFLISGLMSRFDEDWRPVLRAYTRGISNRGESAGAFEGFQSSSWICWLLWGPSIPICTCDQWLGVTAYQYGFGDENNSLPLVELNRPNRLIPLADAAIAEGRNAVRVELTGRFRWGPGFLHGPVVPAEVEDDDDPAYQSSPEAPVPTGHECAGAQTTLHDQDRLVLELSGRIEAHEEKKLYYSAYLWAMFLVAVQGDAAGAGPTLLRGASYPPWPKNLPQRAKVRDQHLWEHLVPVFVHANIADPAAYPWFRLDLVDKSLATLQRIWNSRFDLFSPEDVAKGITFHLVCSSDYTGCGCSVRHPSATTLEGLLAARLDGLQERKLASAIHIPASAEERPWGLAGYFSSCHMPEMVQDYFTYIRNLMENPRPKG